MTVAVDQGGDIEVPDFSGKTMRDVADIALRLGLEPVLVGSNLATEQSPARGSESETRRENHGAVRDTAREEIEAAPGNQELG